MIGGHLLDVSCYRNVEIIFTDLHLLAHKSIVLCLYDKFSFFSRLLAPYVDKNKNSFFLLNLIIILDHIVILC